jgi:hypothetical protein
LEHDAATKKGPAVWRMQPLFYTPAELHGNEVAAENMAELLSVGAVTGIKPGVVGLVEKLDFLCAGEKPPPVAIIRHPRVCILPLLQTSALSSMSSKSLRGRLCKAHLPSCIVVALLIHGAPSHLINYSRKPEKTFTFFFFFFFFFFILCFLF